MLCQTAVGLGTTSDMGSPLVFLGLALAQAHAADAPLNRIAFGSCISQQLDQPIWDAVNSLRPELFLFLGDNIYADIPGVGTMREEYARLAAKPGFRTLLSRTPVLATWDDHDYGKNDAGVEYEGKDAARAEFCDFFGVPKDSPRRTREGIYDSATFGPVGRRVQVILLDTRWSRSPLKEKPEGDTRPGRYVPDDDPTKTMLGEEQWQWLRGELRKPAELRLVCSSIQVVAEDHLWEKWGNLPRERSRLIREIAEAKAGGVVFLSGDRHLAEISVTDAGVGYPLFDVTSSGMNLTAKSWRPHEQNRHRVASMNYGDNFGTVIVDWERADPLVRLQVRGVDGEVVLQQAVRLSWLQPGYLKGS